MSLDKARRRVSVKRATWLPDRQAKVCMHEGCAAAFSLRERRHHCRLCGQIFCGLHTGYSIQLDDNESEIKQNMHGSEDSFGHIDAASSNGLDTRSSDNFFHRQVTSINKAANPLPTKIKARDGSTLTLNFNGAPTRNAVRVRVCNQCFLSVHDATLVRDSAKSVPAGFICYVPFGPPFLTGPGGLGDLRIRTPPTPKGIIMPRARFVEVKRIELTQEAPSPVFVLRVFGGRLSSSKDSLLSKGLKGTPGKRLKDDGRLSKGRARWNVRRLFVHFQDLATYFGVPDSEIPRGTPSMREPHALPVYAEIMNDYIAEWLDTDALDERLQHFLTADSSLMSTSNKSGSRNSRMNGGGSTSHYIRHVPDLVERIARTGDVEEAHILSKDENNLISVLDKRQPNNTTAPNATGVPGAPTMTNLSGAGELGQTQGTKLQDPVTNALSPMRSALLEGVKMRGEEKTRKFAKDAFLGRDVGIVESELEETNIKYRESGRSNVDPGLATSLVHITHAEVCTDPSSGDPHVQYVIRARSSEDPCVWFISRRRFRFFEVLNGQLKRRFPHLRSPPSSKSSSLFSETKRNYILPQLPRGQRSVMNVIGMRKFDCMSVQSKRLSLQRYLRSLIQIPEVCQSEELRTFLGTNPCRDIAVCHGAIENSLSPDSPSISLDEISILSDSTKVSNSNVTTNMTNIKQSGSQENGGRDEIIVNESLQLSHSMILSEKDSDVHEQSDHLKSTAPASIRGFADSTAVMNTIDEKSSQKVGLSARYISMLLLEIAQLKADKAQLEEKVASLEQRIP